MASSSKKNMGRPRTYEYVPQHFAGRVLDLTAACVSKPGLKPVMVTCSVGPWRKPSGGCSLTVRTAVRTTQGTETLTQTLRERHGDLNRTCKENYLDCFTLDDGKTILQHMQGEGDEPEDELEDQPEESPPQKEGDTTDMSNANKGDKAGSGPDVADAALLLACEQAVPSGSKHQAGSKQASGSADLSENEDDEKDHESEEFESSQAKSKEDEDDDEEGDRHSKDPAENEKEDEANVRSSAKPGDTEVNPGNQQDEGVEVGNEHGTTSNKSTGLFDQLLESQERFRDLVDKLYDESESNKKRCGLFEEEASKQRKRCKILEKELAEKETECGALSARLDGIRAFMSGDVPTK